MSDAGAIVGRPRVRSDMEEHDFGTVLAMGQELEHYFIIKNRTQDPLKILSAEALTSCCSSVGPVPESVPPGASMMVPVHLKTGLRTAKRRVGFVITTDRPDVPVHSWRVRAELISAFEVESIEGKDSLSVGEAGSRTFRVTTRRMGELGFATPRSVEIAPPLSAAFTGPPREKARLDGLLETIREVRVNLPASTEPGQKQVDLILGWPEGEPRTHLISWRVFPHIEAVPAGLVVRSTGGPEVHEVVLRAREKPFRVLGGSGSGLSPKFQPTRAASTMQRLRLEIDPARIGRAGTSDLHFKTDDPDQPDLVISIMVLPGAEDSTP